MQTDLLPVRIDRMTGLYLDSRAASTKRDVESVDDAEPMKRLQMTPMLFAVKSPCCGTIASESSVRARSPEAHRRSTPLAIGVDASARQRPRTRE